MQYRVGTGASFQARSLGAMDFRERRRKNLTIWRNVLLALRADATTYGLLRNHVVMQDIQDELFGVETRLLFCGFGKTEELFAGLLEFRGSSFTLSYRN